MIKFKLECSSGNEKFLDRNTLMTNVNNPSNYNRYGTIVYGNLITYTGIVCNCKNKPSLIIHAYNEVTNFSKNRSGSSVSHTR